MQSLARYSLGSGDNVVSLLIALQLKWLTMRDMSRAIPFMSIAAHTSCANLANTVMIPHAAASAEC